MFRKLIATAPVWITVPMRIALGIVFIAHGAQKVLGMWGGPGFSAWIANEKYAAGLRPAWLWLGAAAFSEFFGGILVLIGLLTRVGAFFIGATMLVAIFGSLWPTFFAPKGYEYPFALLAMAVALVIAGGGQASVDRLLMSSKRR